jgi:hypothetical protein
MFIPIGAFFVLLFGRKQWWLAIVLASASLRDRVHQPVHRAEFPICGHRVYPTELLSVTGGGTHRRQGRRLRNKRSHVRTAES